ncbi:amidohydrolase [Archaeoglobus veneficus]|uniref:5-methylthioadenosine/S-adenosylhomocysteine deaminase n=1 Tax=Archaeoglobus veneficus (strain DSM 11195 / SNP6) TaxID=693661 RepID=F2KT74_ARCVS|nr:amidohydrolase [Archaeoglobus veneficus]AEA47104.1 5-methylthioadenosine/S-adenosylhomocysteine deaminase [Archaeoglobus veneficus SNP6]
MSILIKDVKIVDARKAVEGDIYIEENRIAEVGEVKGKKDDIVIDGKGKAVIPGLVNTHTHAAMVLFRSYADDMPLMEWLEKKIWPLEAKLKPDDIYHGTKLACLEMIKSGTTAFNDMYFEVESIAKAVEEMGMRACISSAFFDFFDKQRLEESLKKVEDDLKKLRKFKNVIPAVGPHAPYTVSLDGLKASMELAEKYDALVHFHLAETKGEIEEFKKKYGKGIVEALNEIGFLNERLIAAHCVWLSEEEIRLMAEKNVNVSHCPASNMKLCVGSALNYSAMKKYSLNVTLGTDSAASNNNLDMFEEMKFATLLQKYHYSAPTLMNAAEIFEIATLNGAKALGIKAGLIESGYLADLVMIDLKKPYFTPGHNLIADIVYSAKGDCVDTVIIDGKVVMEGGKVEGEEKIMEEAREAALDLISR